MLLKILLVLLSAIDAFSCDCPGKGYVQSILDRSLSASFTVKDVRCLDSEGLCKVETFEGETFFLDPKGRYLIEGVLIPVLQLRFTEDDMLWLEKAVAFSLGNADRSVYLIVDPACKVCRKSGKELKKFIKKGLKVKFILAPISHGGKGFKSAVSLICDEKGFDDFERGYVSNNICDKGKLRVWSVVDKLKKKGINVVPVVVMPDGSVHIGYNSVRKAIEGF